MTKLLATILLTFFSFGLTAQTFSAKEEEDIRERMGLYLDLIKANNFADMMDYIYPKLFTITTREQMIELYNSLETMGVGMEMNEANLNEIEMLHQDGDKSYALGGYDMKMRLILKKEELQTQETVELIREEFIEQFGEGSLSYDDNSKAFSVKGDNYIIAIKDPEYGDDWYFLEFDPKDKQIAAMLFSAEVIDKAMAKIK